MHYREASRTRINDSSEVSAYDSNVFAALAASGQPAAGSTSPRAFSRSSSQKSRRGLNRPGPGDQKGSFKNPKMPAIRRGHSAGQIGKQSPTRTVNSIYHKWAAPGHCSTATGAGSVYTLPRQIADCVFVYAAYICR